MLKRGYNFIFFLGLTIFLTAVVAAECNLNASLINQDPYPAVPGDYVKLVFQITGVGDPNCGDITAELVPEYPISFDPNIDSKKIIKGGTYTKDYNSYLMVPYKVRVDGEALDGDTPIKLIFGSDQESLKIEQFDLNIKDVRVEFEAYINDYDPNTLILTIEIINPGENDVEALAVEIPDQDNIVIKGSNINVIGALDSKDYTTAEFKGNLKKGYIDLIIRYTDEINERRTDNIKVYFDPKYFGDGKGSTTKVIYIIYLVSIVVLSIIVYFVYKKIRKKKKTAR